LIGAVLKRTAVLSPDKDLFDVLTDYAMFGAVVFETMAVVSIFVFRWKRPDAERPYRCPGYPFTPMIYLICFVGLLASYFVNEKQRIEAYSGLGFALLGAAIYGLFLRKK
jgi:L-asparagine transporter-like permease